MKTSIVCKIQYRVRLKNLAPVGQQVPKQNLLLPQLAWGGRGAALEGIQAVQVGDGILAAQPIL